MKKTSLMALLISVIAIMSTFTGCFNATPEQKLQAYADSPAAQSMLKKANKMADDSATLECYVEDNKFFYKLTMLEQIDPEAPPYVEEYVDTEITAQADAYKSDLKILRKESGVEDAVLVLEFFNADGSLIYETSFDSVDE